MKYANYEDVESGFRTLTSEERDSCEALLEEAAVIIDTYASGAEADRKKVVSCRMVRRVLSSSSASVPMGATQGTVSAGPYSQIWTLGTGLAMGELYLSKTEKALLGIGNHIGAHSPLEDMTCDSEVWV
jgi:hypothetical protein